MIRFLSLLFLITACTIPQSESDKARVATVQEVYEQEFLSAVNRKTAFAASDAFDGTEAAIDAARPGARESVTAYLDVMQGVIYLQTNRIGLARSMTGPVAKAAAVLKPARAVWHRNALIASVYGDLVRGTDGVAQVRKLNASGSSDADPARDGGAALLAGYAASFLASADDAAGTFCLANPDDTTICAPYLAGRPSLVAARDLQASFPGPDITGQSHLSRQSARIGKTLEKWASRPGRSLPATRDACS